MGRRPARHHAHRRRPAAAGPVASPPDAAPRPPEPPGHDRPRSTTGCPTRPAGCIAGDPDRARVDRFYPTRNAAASSRVYTVDPKDHLRADRDAEDRGLEIIGVMHSHTHTEAYPSPTDVAQAPDPTWHYVIVSLARGARAAQLPDRRRDDRRGAGCRRSSGRFPTVAVSNSTVDSDGAPELATRPPWSPHGCVQVRARHDRQHADGRRQPAQPQPGRAHPGQDGGPEPGRLGQGPHRPQDDPRGRGRRHPDAGQDASSSRRRATPASPWP